MLFKAIRPAKAKCYTTLSTKMFPKATKHEQGVRDPGWLPKLSIMHPSKMFNTKNVFN